MKPLKILVTTGPTIEPIDPVRFISNRSTGVMGFALAQEALKKGHKPELIAGPTHIPLPSRIKIARVSTAEEMFYAVKKRWQDKDCVIMAAAVSDFRPATCCRKKIKKRSGRPRAIKLTKNPDILFWMGRHKKEKILIGFCLETEDLIQNARKKLISKNLDLIVANRITPGKNPFGSGKTSVVIINAHGPVARLHNVSKAHVASILLDKAQELWHNKAPACRQAGLPIGRQR